MSESDNITRNLLGKLLRTEISIIRSYRAFLMLLPLHGSSKYQTGSPLLQRRLFGNGFGAMIDNAFEVETRPGSFLVPRSLSKEISWDKFFVAVVDGDTNVIREYDSEDTDFGIYNEGEKVTLLSGQEEFYNPRKIPQLRSKCVDIQNDYLMQVFFMSMLAPEFVSIFFGLKPATVEAIKDVGMSSLKLINDVVLFPRTIPFTPGLGDDSATLKSKVFAWAYEISADIRLGKISDDLMELLRYDTMFTCHRQDVFNTLANKVLLKDY